MDEDEVIQDTLDRHSSYNNKIMLKTKSAIPEEEAAQEPKEETKV